MRNPVEIQIFVSNPRDVDDEKRIIENICNRINYQLAEIDCDVRYLVKEWSKITGKFGVNTQIELETVLGSYDLYFGIWWNKFGSETGIINPETGEDYGSGTYREFCLAYESWNTSRFPEIYLFFKKKQPDNLYDLNVLAEIQKVVEFEKSQHPNGFCHHFENETIFERRITDLLWKKATKLCIKLNIDKKKTFLDEKNINFEILNFSLEIEEIPDIYIPRTISHFSSIKEKQKIISFQDESQRLEKIILSKDRILLLGDAGSGKSTELTSLFHKLKKRKESPLIPLVQKLNSYTPERGIEEYLPELWKKIPPHLLIIIWDGLDEIQPKHFHTVVRQINAFSNRHKEIKILISCRTNFYEFPVNNSTGTLPGFEPYLINDINIRDAKEYYSRKYSSSKSDIFIREVFDKKLEDLITKPFFLMLLADRFNQEQSLQLNRADLFESFLLKRIMLDQNHFKTSVDLRSKKQEILLLLQKVALSMEILSRNQINESEILALITSEEFNSLKYCTSFKKKDGEDDIWQFEHNNIQEFLAGKALSNLQYDKIIQFIAFAPNYTKLIPSWVNTLAFLFSILDSNGNQFEKLLQWILENEKEVMVKFEPDKIAEELRVQIFQGIFNYYKNHDVWISSNKFSDRELARFGQSELNLHFLIKEIQSEENTRTVYLNAIRLIGHFQIENDDMKLEVEKLLMAQIDRNIKDHDYIHPIIYSLKWAGITGADTIKKLMKKVDSSENQYIRAAMYAILEDSDGIEDYVGYLIEGYELIEKCNRREIDGTFLTGEILNLNECVKNIKSSKGIKEIVAYASENTRFTYGLNSRKVIEPIILNAVEAYKKDKSIFDALLIWFIKDISRFRMKKTNFLLQFFIKTKTREKAFNEVWGSKEDDKERTKSLAIAKLLTPDVMQFVIDEYLNQNLPNKELEVIYFDMVWVGNENRDHFLKLVREHTDFEINIPEEIDQEELQYEKLKDDFRLLFNARAFKEATLEVFKKEKKDVLFDKDLFEIKEVNNQWVNIDQNYPSGVLRLLRDLVHKDKSITKGNVIKWFERTETGEWYRVSQIYNYLTANKELEIDSINEQWIKSWCKKNVDKVNFKDALTVHDNGRITYKTMAVYLWYFSIRFSVNHSKMVLLDMLSFGFSGNRDWDGINYIKSKLDHDVIAKRMLVNIKDGIANDLVLKNHMNYLLQNDVEESYPIILDEIINLKRSIYLRLELLDLYYDHTKDTESLKTIIKQADSRIRWSIVTKLIANKKESYAIKYLHNFLENNNDKEEVGNAVEILVKLQDIKGLKAYIEWFRKNIKTNVATDRVMCLNRLIIIEAIPYLLELLEISYEREIKVDGIDRFNSIVLGAFSNIAFISDENFDHIISSLKKFMTEKYSEYDNVKYLLHSIERMEEQYYMDKAQSFSIEEVKEKLSLL